MIGEGYVSCILIGVAAAMLILGLVLAFGGSRASGDFRGCHFSGGRNIEECL